MNFVKKITHFLALIFLAYFLVSCDSGCVSPSEFDVESVEVKSNPTNDGVAGVYDDTVGGQVATWHETGLKSNGDPFIVQISGDWSPWFGNSLSANELKALPLCTMCAKNIGSPNCLCYPGQNPAAENFNARPRDDVNCALTADQNDPAKCTCTKDATYGNALDFGVYHIILNAVDKNELLKVADDQTACRLNQGMGLYIGLFGSRGVEIPKRAYHMYATDTICNIQKNSDGRCIDSNGIDRTQYIYYSPNNRIFVKDDKNGNNGTDTDTSDDEYHTANEEVKFIIYDSYYADNYGQYNLSILRGVGSDTDGGLLEFIVRLVEDTLLGPINDEGKRDGGIIRWMYMAIVQDSGFITILQISLSFYIAFYGLAHLMGLAQITYKELVNRVIKIGLIIFFTSKTSWNFYNDLVVGLFKDVMDYVVASIMNITDANIDPTSMIKIAQMDRAADASNATRFSYVDLIIKKLLSAGTAKKVFGLFFADIFGIIYIPIIYFLIGFFIYVMLTIAVAYIVALIKIIFVLSLGPIFIVFSLFSYTQGMFKNWISFLGSRSLEIVVLFTILYNFLLLIDKAFTDMLYYETCGDSYNFGLFTMRILKSHISRSLLEWLLFFVKIGGLTFITQLMINKAAGLASSLISIGGQSSGGGGFGSASGIVGSAFKASMKGIGLGLKGLSTATLGEYGLVRLATAVARKSGIAGAWNRLGEKIPFSGPRTAMRNSIIDSALRNGANSAAAAGLTKGTKAFDAHVRAKAMDELRGKMFRDPHKMRALGLDDKNIEKRFGQKLVNDAYKNQMKDNLKNLRGKFHGQDLLDEAKKKTDAWANQNLVGGANAVSDKIKSAAFKGKELSSEEAAKLYAGNEDAKNKYLQHLKDLEFERERRKANAGFFGKIGVMASRGYHNLKRDAAHNPKLMQKNFMRKAAYEEGRGKGWFDKVGVNTSKGFSLKKRINLFDNSNDELMRRTQEAQARALRGYLGDDENSERARFFKKQLADLATRDLQEQMEKAKNDAALAQALRDKVTAEMQAKLSGTQDGRSFFEANERYKLVGGRDLSAEIADKIKLEAEEAAKKKIEESNIEQIKDTVEKLKSTSFFSSDFKVDFGSSAAQILLQDGPDIGLKASNPLLTQEEKKGEIDYALKNDLTSQFKMNEAKLRITELSKKATEFEIMKLERNASPTDAEKVQLVKLKKELVEVEADIRRFETSVNELQGRINSL